MTAPTALTAPTAQAAQAAQSDPTDPLAETVLDSRLAWAGGFLKVYADTVRAPDGHVSSREYVRHPGAVMVIPLLDDGQLVLERQYRHPVGRSFIELPAGKIDAGESLLACAQRELREETGYTARHWQHLGGFHNAIGYSDERLDVFLARGLTHEGAQADAGEVLEIFTAPWLTVLDWIRQGQVTDVKTIIGVCWLREAIAGTWPPSAATG
jgi:ADP-ribose pyrophosphatase